MYASCSRMDIALDDSKLTSLIVKPKQTASVNLKFDPSLAVFQKTGLVYI